jgi:hypothetical protein
VGAFSIKLFGAHPARKKDDNPDGSHNQNGELLGCHFVPPK